VENVEIARVLSELADLLEIRGANPFRVRAYRNAVRTVRGLTRSLSTMVQEGEDLTDLPGIGKDMAGHIQELSTTGSLELLEEVCREVPRSLATLVKLEGVGPKKASKLWKELDVTNLDDLEAALQAGRVQELEGFGAKSAAKILRSIREVRQRQGRFLRYEAEQYLRPLLEYLRSTSGVERIEVAGSYRRGKETVGDADLLAQVDGGEEEQAAVIRHFTSFPGVDRVVMSGGTRASIMLGSGFGVDLRVLPARSYGAALHYFTGSKEHNVEIRKLALRKGLRVSEYGVFRVSEEGREGGEAAEGGPEAGERLGGEAEEEVFAAVDLPWIPPVLREARGEIEAAREGTLPRLVTREDIRGDLHMHSTWSDGKNSILEMAEACRDLGYEYMAITDHSEAVRVANGLTPERVRAQWKEIEEVREAVAGIHVLRGLEVDILRDGTLDLPDEVLEGLDIVLVAVHSSMGLEQAEMTRRVIRAIRHPAVDVLVHPTGRLLNRREPYAIDMDAVLESAAEAGVAVEMNANPHRLDLNDVHLLRARELGLRVSIATDSHRPAHLDFMEGGLLQAQRGWVEKERTLNALSLESLQEWLARPRNGR